MKSHMEIVEELVRRFEKEPKENQKEFRECSKENLVSYHHSLGRSIRNEFNLWKFNWAPELKDGVDYSPYHPDNLSMTIIDKVHDIVKDELP